MRPLAVENGTLKAYPAGHAAACNQNEFSAQMERRSERDVAVPTANAVQRIARSFCEEALMQLVRIMHDREVPGSVRIKAYEAVLNRGIGLPAPPVDVTVQQVVLAEKVCECTIEELRSIESHLADQARQLSGRTPPAGFHTSPD
jgi:hypothetical protein